MKKKIFLTCLSIIVIQVRCCLRICAFVCGSPTFVFYALFLVMLKLNISKFIMLFPSLTNNHFDLKSELLYSSRKPKRELILANRFTICYFSNVQNFVTYVCFKHSKTCECNEIIDIHFLYLEEFFFSFFVSLLHHETKTLYNL